MYSLAAAIGGLASVADAADKPVFAPAPDWVKAAPANLTPSKSAAGTAVAFLLMDTQVKLTAQGSTTYQELVATAQAPQGLQALGAVNLDWRPDTDRLIIHKLHILRDGKVIDALANGPGFTVLRRETKLEEAALDGTLTAAMQLEGLQVGDTLDFAYSTERADPILRGRVQQVFPLNEAPVSHLRVRALWPTALAVKPKLSEIEAPFDVQTHGDTTEAMLSLDDTQSYQAPKLAPARFLRGRELELSNFASWNDVSGVLEPAFAEASRIAPGSPLQAEIKKIADQSQDPKARAQAALSLVQDQVRYVFLGLDGGGLRPASADQTWSRRFGDCKGKTTLLIAILHGLGIEAEPALVSSAGGDGLDGRLPMLGQFDHVLVRATIGGRVYWLDGARVGDRTLDDIVTPPFFWALPMRPSGAALVRLETQPLSAPPAVTTVRLDASAGLTQPAPAHVDIVFKGDPATALNLQFSNLAPADRDKALRTFWTSQYDFIEVKSAEAKYDRQTGEERLSMDGSAKMDWSSGYEIDGSNLGSKLDLTRMPGPHADAPFAIVFPAYERRSETIVLPNKGQGYTINGQDIDETVGRQVLSRRSSIKDGVFTMEVSQRAIAPEMPASEAPGVAKRLAELVKMRLFVNQPGYAALTPQERTAILQSKPTTVEEYLQRASARLDSRAVDDALADYTEAAKLDPKSSRAIAGQAVAHAWKGDVQKARAEADEALKLDPKEIVARHAQGMVAERAEKWADEIIAYSAAIDASQGDVFALQHRAYAFMRLRDSKRALADSEAALKLVPVNPDVFLIQANVYLDENDPDRALAVAKQIEAIAPDNPAVKTTVRQIRERAERIRVALADWKKDLDKKAKAKR
jgi:tetratricopeptide (TPR) repeat protein/transglutaminase-like putative cysteine protease